MRPWILVGTTLFARGTMTSPTHHYRVEIEETNSVDDGTAPISDTSVVSAMVSLSIADSAGTTTATFTIDSASFRHSTGPGHSNFSAIDPHAAGTSARFRVIAGRLENSLSLSYGGYPPSRWMPGIVATFHYFFPDVRQTAKHGDEWSDTTRMNGGTTVSTWTITAATDGLLKMNVIDAMAAVARNPDGAQVASRGTTSRDMTSTIAGPVVRATIHRESHGSGSDPSDPATLTFAKSSTTRIVRLD